MFRMHFMIEFLSYLYCLTYFLFNIKSNTIIKRTWNIK